MSFLKYLFGGHHGSNNGRNHENYNAHFQSSSNKYFNKQQLKCQNCSGLNDPQSRFCQQCGISIADIACTNCNQTLAAGSQFCNKCGNKI